MAADRPDSPVTASQELAACLRRLVRDAERREGRSLDRVQLAKQINVSKSSLYAYLDGTTLISAETLHRLLLTLDVPEREASRVRRDRDAAAEPSAAGPVWLPLDLDCFAGRAEHLNELDQLRRNARKARTVVIAAVSGTGGIGKTALAVHWAHRRRSWFPDGCLHLDLRGFHTNTPLEPAEALATLLRRLGTPGHAIPSTLDERVEQYQRRLRDKRTLILLDNAFTSQQVLPLLPPPNSSCFVLITSRDQLAGLSATTGARRIAVDALPEHEARDLIAARLGTKRLYAEPAPTAELLRACAGLPLALTIIAGRAEAHPHIPLAALATELRDESTRLAALDEERPSASLPAVLALSHRSLEPEQARVFGLLGIAPGPDISLLAAANLANLTDEQTNTVLRDLERVSLVHQYAPGRYRMHDLIRLYATETAHLDLSDGERDWALRRVLDFYTHSAHTANRLLEPHAQPIQLDPLAPGVHPQQLSDVPATMAWFDAEHPNLLAAQHTATGHGWHPTVWQLAWTLHTFHYWRGHRHDQLSVWRAALDAAAHLPDAATRTIAHRRLGHAHTDLGRHEEAIGHLHQALALAEANHDPDQQAHAHRGLAWAWERWGDDRQALQHATRARDLHRTLDQPVWEAEALNGMGWYAARLGEFDTARTHCQAALTLYRHHHEPDGEAATLDSLGYIAHHTGHHQQAIGYYHRARTLFRALGNTYQSANTLDALGHPHVVVGEPEQARRAWREALELYQHMGRDADAARVQRQLDHLDTGEGAAHSSD